MAGSARVDNNNPTKLLAMLDFIEDSQDQYLLRYGSREPFIPAYVWDRYDLGGSDETPGTWTFNWTDPNSEWVGYTARTVAS